MSTTGHVVGDLVHIGNLLSFRALQRRRRDMRESVTELTDNQRRLIQRAKELNQQSLNRMRNETIRELLVDLGILLPYQRDKAYLDTDSDRQAIGAASR